MDGAPLPNQPDEGEKDKAKESKYDPFPILDILCLISTGYKPEPSPTMVFTYHNRPGSPSVKFTPEPDQPPFVQPNTIRPIPTDTWDDLNKDAPE